MQWKAKTKKQHEDAAHKIKVSYVCGPQVSIPCSCSLPTPPPLGGPEEGGKGGNRKVGIERWE